MNCEDLRFDDFKRWLSHQSGKRQLPRMNCNCCAMTLYLKEEFNVKARVFTDKMYIYGNKEAIPNPRWMTTIIKAWDACQGADVAVALHYLLEHLEKEKAI